MRVGIITFRDLLNTFRALEIDPSHPVIAHAALGAFGRVHGGPQVMVGALLAAFPSVIMPSFTYKTMVTPEIGPQNNALNYGKNGDSTRLAEIYHPDMPADPLMGIVPETLRRHPKAQRSRHPFHPFAHRALDVADRHHLDVIFFQERRQVELAGGAVFSLDTSYRAHRELVGGLNAILKPVLGTEADPRRPWMEPFSPLVTAGSVVVRILIVSVPDQNV